MYSVWSNNLKLGPDKMINHMPDETKYISQLRIERTYTANYGIHRNKIVKKGAFNGIPLVSFFT